jgi:hypothetical protein
VLSRVSPSDELVVFVCDFSDALTASTSLHGC